MTRWIALLRGVNVNGITIRSADLRALFAERGYRDVRTVLASGNVVFDAEADGGVDAGSGGSGGGGGGRDGEGDGGAAALQRDVQQALRDRFGYDAWIVLVPHAALAAVVEGFPFPSSPDRHDYVVFGSEDAALDDLLAGPDLDPAVEQVSRGDRVVYWSCPKGSSTDTVFARRAAAARFKRTTTTRNVTTLRKLL